MTALTHEDVGVITKRLNDMFEKRVGDKVVICDPKSRADKRRLAPVVQKLSDYTDLVQQAASEGPGGLAEVWLDVFGGGGSPGQWTLDMSRWRERLAAYQFALDNAKFESGLESCAELKDTVTLPLIMGWYQPGTPGIANPEVRSYGDAATPFILGNGITVYHEFAKENFDRFVQDVKKNVLKLAKAGMGLATKVLIAGGVGLGLYAGYELTKRKNGGRAA